MTLTTETLNLEMACSELADRAKREGRAPVRWLWGPDARESFSRFLDAMAPMLIHGPQNLPNDGRICDFAGLPAYPMECDGAAVRTVAEQ